MPSFAATIAIIDTGFDLDHDFLRPKILKQTTDEEISGDVVKEFHGWNFHDNSHLKKAVIEDRTALEEVLLYRNLRAKGHREGLSLDEFEWFKNKSADKDFMELVKKFKRHSHGTFVAGIALREGDNINIFPIRGLNIPSPVVAVEDSSPQGSTPSKNKNPDLRFQEEIKNSLNRVSKKFSKICHYLSQKNIQVVNASYGITYKNIITRFRESYKEITGKDIDELQLQGLVDKYFQDLYSRGIKTIKKYPKMLFVFSAGNSGLDNDKYHHYPSKIKLPNTLSVAAMNGDYLATFSNYGLANVDIGAPGVAILSLVPTVYSQDGKDIYSPSSGTSMAAPYISNLAAQIMNANPTLSPAEVKTIILETGDEKLNLKEKLSSSSIVNNQRALKAALLAREISLPQAITLSRSDLIPMEDEVSMGMPPAISADSLKNKVMESIPQAIRPEEVDEEPTIETVTKSLSSSKQGQVKDKPGKSDRPLLVAPTEKVKSSDPVPSNQIEEQSPPLSEEQMPSSSQSEPQPPEAPDQASVPSSP